MAERNNGPVIGLCVECLKTRMENGGLVLCEMCERERKAILKAIEHGEMPSPSLLCPRCKENNEIGFVRAKDNDVAWSSETAVEIQAFCDRCGAVYSFTEARLGFPVGLMNILR